MVENARQAYDAFNRLWAKVPRHVRVDRENHLLMLEVRAFFDGIIEAAKRAAIVDSALAAAKVLPNGESGPASEDVEVDPVRQALRLLRTLGDLEWAMVKAVVDLHDKFTNDDFVDILNVIHDTHCRRCGEWLDDEDEHEDCPVPEEDDDVAAEAEPREQNAGAVVTAPPHAVIATTTPLTQAPESEPKITPRE